VPPLPISKQAVSSQSLRLAKGNERHLRRGEQTADQREKKDEKDVFDTFQTEIGAFVRGGVYLQGTRPHNSLEEDCVIGFLTGLDKDIQEKFGSSQKFMMTSEDVAKEIIKMIEKKKRFSIIGFRNKLSMFLINLLPISLQLRLAGVILKKVIK